MIGPGSEAYLVVVVVNSSSSICFVILERVRGRSNYTRIVSYNVTLEEATRVSRKGSTEQ